MFSAPFCNECQDLDDEFSKAAKFMSQQKPSVYFAKIDGQHRNFEIYTGQTNTAQDYQNWINKKIFNGVKVIYNEREYNRLIKNNEILVIYLGYTNSTQFKKAFEIVARRYDNAFFTRIDTGSEIEKQFSIESYPALLLQTKQQNFTYNGYWDTNSIQRWISLQSIPNPVYYDTQYFNQLFKEENEAIFLFINYKMEEQIDLEYEFQKIAIDLKSDLPQAKHIILAITDVKNIEQKRVADTLGIIKSDFPVLAYIHPTAQGIETHIISDQDMIYQHLSYDYLKEFIEAGLRRICIYILRKLEVSSIINLRRYSSHQLIWILLMYNLVSLILLQYG
ncbi:disulfide isomerase [Stylonychia lemnae]|uniref:Disulfide isomerase n=1 Tax=Stylonychia lemnae TaxID=5949 RepID=A0A077ZTH3_STYLE|nr:disulfide isomerase [Stylonychia lemnae]|eukprot:CDW72814.1 disulfide isomerase [Stylonychia lemnae]